MLAQLVQVVVKVAIIGAGISGIGASYQFTKQGVQHVIIEARDRVGGRIASTQIEGVTVQLGAVLVQSAGGPDQKKVLDIYQSFNWTFIPRNKESTYQQQRQVFFEGKGRVKQSTLTKALKISDQLCRIAVAEQKKTKRPLSLRQALGNHLKKGYRKYTQEERDIADQNYNLIANDEGANITNMGTAFCQLSTKDYQPKGGYAAFVQHIYSTVKPKNVYFNELVTKIDYSGDKVRIYTNGKVYIADKVISSLPLGVLMKGSVQFVPKIPQSQTKALSDLGYGIYNKIYISFQKPFWDITKTFITHVTKGNLQNRYGVAQSIVENGKYILCIFVNDGFSREVSNFTIDQLHADLLSYFKRFHPHKDITIRTLLRTNWLLDPLTYSSYTYDLLGKDPSAAAKKICVPLDNKVWLIGEHCHHTLHGYSQGAFMTGILAAEAIKPLVQ